MLGCSDDPAPADDPHVIEPAPADDPHEMIKQLEKEKKELVDLQDETFKQHVSYLEKVLHHRGTGRMQKIPVLDRLGKRSERRRKSIS